MTNKKIEVQGLNIRIKSFHDDDYVSLTDIAAKIRRGQQTTYSPLDAKL